MEFLFFDAADAALFVRDDAESARWTVEEMSLVCEFPYDAEKPIQRGQRIGFTDEVGVFQPFEIRKVETMEPDHYQRVTAEHIAVSELSDEHVYQTEITDTAIDTALAGLLTNTLWTVGTVGDQTVQSADISTGSVWQAVRSLEENYNVYITPRVTFDAGGITGRYLDIAPAGGVWRGVRLALDKNADDVGVTYDDTELITAMYGYGKLTNSAPLTFESVTWAQTDDHPAKPSGQAYIVDPDALAAYGRNGRNRWGYYQNGNISDPEILLEKTWQALKQASQPTITIDCSVRDLYRMGYADQPIRLHDLALVDVEPIGVQVQLEITCLTVDLLDPTATRPTIGTYIPNIVYINRQTARAGGGGGGGGGRGQSNKEAEISEFETEIYANQYEIGLRAYQRDMTNVETILKQAGVAVDAGGVIIYADNNLDDMKSSITTNASTISAVVEGTGPNATLKASIVVGIVNGSSSIDISADYIKLNGTTSISSILTGQAIASALASTDFSANNVYVLTTLSYQGTQYYSRTLKLGNIQSATSLASGGTTAIDFDHAHAMSMDSSGNVTAGAAVAVGDSSATFNVAATAWFQQQIAAAQQGGASGVTLSQRGWDGSGNNIVDASNGATETVSLPSFSTSGGSTWSGGVTYVYFSTPSVNVPLATKQVSMPSSASSFSVTVDGPSGAHGTYSARCTVGGKSYTKSGSWSS